MYVIHCCEYDDQRPEILASCCFLGLYIHYRVSSGKVNRSDPEVARYNKMHFRCNIVLVQRCQMWHLCIHIFTHAVALGAE
jgi:hypothetical protein